MLRMRTCADTLLLLVYLFLLNTNVLQGGAPMGRNGSCNLLRMRTYGATPYPGEFIPTNVLQGAALMSVNASCNLLRVRTCADTLLLLVDIFSGLAAGASSSSYRSVMFSLA